MIVLCGVPQGSVVGLILYPADRILLVESHNLSLHLYAGDTQVYGSCQPDAAVQLQARVSALRLLLYCY